MPNTYKVRGAVAYLDLRNREGKILAVAKVDRDLLPKLLERTWGFSSKNGYVHANGRGGGKKNVYLHRFVAKTDGTKMWTDHKNGDKLDNRGSNLRAVSATQSQMNKRTKRGAMRAIWPNHDGTWQVRVTKTFDSVKDAQRWRDAVNDYVHGIDFMEECGLWAVKMPKH